MIGGGKMLFRQAISRRIFELCELYKYTPNKLAEMSGIPPTTLQDMVSEKMCIRDRYQRTLSLLIYL